MPKLVIGFRCDFIRGAGGQGQNKKYFTLAIFFAAPIFAFGMKPIINFFCILCGQQHLVPGITYFRKSFRICTVPCSALQCEALQRDPPRPTPEASCLEGTWPAEERHQAPQTKPQTPSR